MKRLIEIQNELKAPKDQRNSFGGYNYRSCEGILEAVKPLLYKHKLALILNDEVISIDGGFDVSEISKDEKCNKETTRHIIASNRVYIKATATLLDEDGKEIAKASALAREEETKKGMDYSQLTGSTSSYARKYALNGLFAIDDTKDSDATNTHGKEEKKSKNTDFVPDVIKNKETDDTDIYLGLSETVDTKSALKYFNEYKDKVNDKAAFTQAWKDHIKTFGKKEE